MCFRILTSLFQWLYTNLIDWLNLFVFFLPLRRKKVSKQAKQNRAAKHLDYFIMNVSDFKSIGRQDWHWTLSCIHRRCLNWKLSTHDGRSSFPISMCKIKWQSENESWCHSYVRTGVERERESKNEWHVSMLTRNRDFENWMWSAGIFVCLNLTWSLYFAVEQH